MTLLITLSDDGPPSYLSNSVSIPNPQWRLHVRSPSASAPARLPGLRLPATAEPLR